ncbi:hypothetical protein BDQ17DRAFT_1352115 [Cyathus striatus]|nr:hypothetical protein BDQ17DRAFT_1352115 [Cyathus striatus]
MSVPASARQVYLPTLGSLDNLKIKEVPVPKPRANDVLVKIHAVSLQYRDLMIATGRYREGKLPDNLVPCSDSAGEVVAVGEDVTKWKVGDRVCANFATEHVYGDLTRPIQLTSMGGQAQGVLTEFRTFPSYSLVKIPGHLSYEEASTLPCAGLTAYNALNGPTPVKAGDDVLVLGTGGVSIWALQLAVAAGANVIATSSSDEKLKVATKLGAKHVINYKKVPDWDQEVLKFTNGRGVDHVIEVGGDGTLPKSIASMRHAATAHIIGFVAGPSNSESPVISLISKAITFRGIQIGSVAQFEALNRLLAANPEVTRPVIDKVFPFEQAPDAYRHLQSQKHVGKVVIKVA